MLAWLLFGFDLIYFACKIGSTLVVFELTMQFKLDSYMLAILCISFLSARTITMYLCILKWSIFQ